MKTLLYSFSGTKMDWLVESLRLAAQRNENQLTDTTELVKRTECDNCGRVITNSHDEREFKSEDKIYCSKCYFNE